MKRVSFFRVHLFHLLILIGILVYLAYSLLSHIWDRAFDLVIIDIMAIVGITVIIIYGFYQRNVTNWCVAKIDASKIITYTLFNNKLCEIDLSKPVYCATVWIPGDKYTSTRVLVVSNNPFSLPAEKKRFRKQYRKSQQALLINCWASDLNATCIIELGNDIPYRVLL